MTFTKTADLPVTPDEAFALITEPERLRRWLTVTARVDLRAGGSYRWTVTPGHIAAGTVREVEPGRRVILGWGSDGSPDLPVDASTVTITVEPTEGGSRVTLVHDGLTEEQEVNHAEGWNHFFGRLEVAALKGDAGPDEWAASPENMDHHSAAEASLAVLQGVLRQVGPGDRDKATPCADYATHDLAEHLIGSLVGLGAMAGAEISRPDAATLEDTVATVAADLLEAWRARGLEGTVPGPAGEIPATIAAGIISIEFLLHAWDFAQAIDATLTVSDEVVDFVRQTAEIVVPGRRGKAFADEVEAPAGADALTRLAAFSGRAVAA